jgi:ribosomal protein S18 acetylase RimI-like enzyme
MPRAPSNELRPAAAADAARIRDLVRAAYAKWVPLIGREPLPMTADYDRAIREHEITLLYSEGRLVALIETVARGDHLFIENVAVLPQHQGRGFGRLLLADAERIALSRGLRETRLFTNRLFEANIALYQAIGYRIDREEPFMGGTVVHMSKRIATAFA